MNQDKEKFDNFIESIKIGNIEVMKSNFDLEYFNKDDKYGLKPIHWACLTSNIEILEWMLQENCNIESSSKNGWRPIHFAYFIEHGEMVQFLIEKFCMHDCHTDNGETVLDIANGNCNHEFIDEILNKNINLKIGLSMGLTCSANCNHKFCLRSVIQGKFDKSKELTMSKFIRIFTVDNTHSNKQFTIRTIDKTQYNLRANAKCVLPNINQILPNLNHSKIVKWFGMIEVETEMILFMELMNNGSLRDEIKLHNVLVNNKINRYCKDILQAVAFLHDNKILHRFIDVYNIFIDNNGGCKLAISSFSYSLAGGDIQSNEDYWISNNKTSSFEAPEINNILSYPYDIWCLGCTVIHMLTGHYPQYLGNILYDLKMIISQISDGMLKSFVQSMMMINPIERANSNDLLNHGFIKNLSVSMQNNNQSIIDNS